MRGLTADMGAGHLQIFADEMHQQRCALDEAFDLGASSPHGDVGFGMRPPLTEEPWRATSARITMIAANMFGGIRPGRARPRPAT